MGIYGDIYKMLTVPPIVNKQKKKGKSTDIQKRKGTESYTAVS